MADANKIGALPLLLAWAATAGAFTAKAALTASSTPLILDTDDAMRLTEVRDFLGGQNWFDLVQHRLNTPYGGLIHWSRLIDLPEALLLGLLRLPFGTMADTIAAYAWPLLLLVPLLWLSAKLALRFGGREALVPGLLLPAFSLITMAEFAPGRLDHHSAQILLALVMLYCAIRALERPRYAIGAGLAAAAALAIGIEALPMVGATILVFGLSWAAEPRNAVAMRDFGLSFATGMGLALAQGVPPEHWLAPMFDAISIVYAIAAALCSLAFVLLPLLPLRTMRGRLIAGIVAGLAIAAIVVVLWPAILKGPYGMLDPWLITNWIDRISEAQPWLASLLGDPVYPLAIAVPPLLALGFGFWNIVRNQPHRARWLVYCAVLLVTLFITILQIRAARMATPIAVPGCAALIAAAWRLQLSRQGIAPALAVVGSWLGSAGIAVGIVATLGVMAVPDYAAATDDSFRGARQACLIPSAFTDLAALPPERIMTPIDLGSHMLAFTPHAVVAAPYHRNQEAVLDAFHFFNQPITEARKILAARGIGLVVICPAMKEIRGLVDHTPDSFVSLYAAGKLPPWLVDQSLPASPLRIYAVMPQ
jgi:hypothetical protein